MNYTAKVRLLFHTENDRHSYAVQSVKVDKKSDLHIILALKKLLGLADYKILDVEWEQA